LAAALAVGAWLGMSAAGPVCAQPIDDAQAAALVAPLYRALTARQADEIAPLIEQATTPDWQDCSGESECQDRAAVIARLSGRIAVLPDYRWARRAIYVSGSSVIVRGEAEGTPARSLLGVAPNGRSFRIMTLDIHEIRDGRIARTFHVEDWAGAVRQLSVR